VSHAHFPVKHVDRIGFQVRGNCEFVPVGVPVVRPIWVRRVNASFVKESIIIITAIRGHRAAVG